MRITHGGVQVPPTRPRPTCGAIDTRRPPKGCPQPSPVSGRSAREFPHSALVALAVATMTLWAKAFTIGVPHDEDVRSVALDPSVETSATATPKTKESSAVPPAASPSEQAPSQIGEVRTGDHADTTLLQIRKIVAPADRQPPSGQEWFGLRARTCLQDDARRSGALPWNSWAVTSALGESYVGEEVPFDDFPPEQFPTTGLDAGECSVGWVLIATPRGTYKDVTRVTFRPGTPGAADWTV